MLLMFGLELVSMPLGSFFACQVFAVLGFGCWGMARKLYKDKLILLLFLLLWDLEALYVFSLGSR